jgi:hypothetical protein
MFPMTAPAQDAVAASGFATRATGEPSSRRISIRRPIGPSLCLVVLLVLAPGAPLFGQEEPDNSTSGRPAPGDTSSASSDHQGLAKELQNPFANLILFPLQNITALGIGPDDGTANTLNLQPVVPLHVNEKWNLLMRPILPVSYTSVPGSEFGLGDLNLEPFLSPRKAGSVAWGAGVILGVPTATGDHLGTGKWTAGPSFALFALRGHWTFSLIANQQWSFAGDSTRDSVSLLQLQPSVSYILDHGWFVVSGPLISADWTEPSGNEWTVPVGAGAGRVFSVGNRKMSLQLEAYANAIRPDDGPENLILFTCTFIFPH